MRYLINIILILVCVLIGWLIVGNIKEPIAFANELDKRQGAVSQQLSDIRTAQEVYKKITGNYAANFDTLKQVLREGNIELYKIIGNLDDQESETLIDTIRTRAVDSMRSLAISIDSLDYVPFGRPGAAFKMDADTLTYQSILVNVVEVGIQKKEYMGDFADKKYMKYDPMYNPDDMIKFGDMNSPNTSGNWK